ncbi:MAG: HK97 family phage prohead protease [Anaerolineae bacterium]|nr:HK97 family phage prohead protease [Anaerolineae bacterium]
MERKTFPNFVKAINNEQGIVEHIFAVMGNVDEGLDVILNGAFKKTIQERGKKVRVLDQHNTDSINRAIGKPLEIQEIGKADLPKELLAEYPDATGGVWAKTQFLLDTPEGKGAFIRLRDGAIDEWSFGYDAVDTDTGTRELNGKTFKVRFIKQLKLYEYSPVLWGMNPATTTLGAKEKKEDAPGYAMTESVGASCVTCTHAIENNWCTLYEFEFDPEYTCESFEPQAEETLEEIAEGVEEALEDVKSQGDEIITQLVEAGANPDEIIAIYTNGEGRYYFNFGDWAEDTTIEAVRQTFADDEWDSEAEHAPPEDGGWVQIWPDAEKAKAEEEEPQDGMVALVVPADVAGLLALDVDGALPADLLHITLAYIPDVSGIDTDALDIELSELALMWAAEMEPLTGTINGLGRFFGVENRYGDPADAFHAIPDISPLPKFRGLVCEALENLGVEYSKQHGFVPHITLAYLPPDTDNPIQKLDPVPVTFTELAFVYGDQKQTYPLTLEEAETEGKAGRTFSQRNAKRIAKAMLELSQALQEAGLDVEALLASVDESEKSSNQQQPRVKHKAGPVKPPTEDEDKALLQIIELETHELETLTI